VPEGDTIHSAARRIREVLVGSRIEEIETPQPRHALDRWPERLDGRAVRAVDASGKHLFIRFEGDLTLHSHLRMRGRWNVYRRGERWRRSRRRAWLVLRTDEHEVVQFDGPVLELMTDSRTRLDQRIAGLGPDLLAEDFDERRFLRRLREDDQTRGVGDALLDQRNLAGVGNMWK
jgi:endonuclease-8